MRAQTWKWRSTRTWGTALIAAAMLLATGGCDKVRQMTGGDQGPGPAAKPAAPAASPLRAKLLGRTWTGKIGKEPIQVKFAAKGDDLTAEVVYTLFGRPEVKEQAAVTISPQGTVRIKGVSHKRLLGAGKFELDDMRVKLSPDGTTLKGGSLDAYNPKGIAVSMSTTATLAQVDPPLDVARATQALVSGKWEGKQGSRPAKLVVTQKGGNLSGKMTAGNATTAVQVQVTPTGQVILRAQPKPTSAGLMTETWGGMFLSTDLVAFGGTWEQVAKQGFIEQSSSDAFVLQDLTKTKK